MNCPKCGFEQTGQDLECLKCGVIFDKYLKLKENKPSLAASGTRQAAQSEQLSEFFKNLFCYVKPETNPLIFGGRVLVIHLSSLFDWFEEDFVEGSGSVVDFLRAYSPVELQGLMREHEDQLSIEHLGYDWSLNGPATKEE